MRITTGILAASLLVGASSIAMADPLVGPYLGLSGGINWSEDKTFTLYDRSPFGGNPGGDYRGKAEYDLGYAVSLQGGYSWGGPRAELEVTWRGNDIDKFKGVDTYTGINADGEVRGKASYMNSLAGMANILYDFSTNSDWTPYLGAGVGVAHLWFKAAGDRNTDTLFAYQGIAGISYNMDQNWSIKLDYRYFATLDPRFSGNYGYEGANGIAKGHYRNHTLMLGFTYNFGEPTVATVVTPMPTPNAQSYLVFFDFDKSNITYEAASVIRQASDDAKAGRPTRIEAIGHTDTVGTSAYNMGLSQRRADSVKAELIKNGVPAHIIETIARGESDPLVPTGDGVREPQNRRVQIVL